MSSDFDESCRYCGSVDLSEALNGDLQVAGHLGEVKFPNSVRVRGRIQSDPGTHLRFENALLADHGIEVHGNLTCDHGISAGRGIRVSGTIRSSEGLQAGWGIVAEEDIVVGRGIRASDGIRAGRHIVAEGGIHAGWSITAGGDIRSGMGICAGESIECGETLSFQFRLFAGTATYHSSADQRCEVRCRFLEGGSVGYGTVLEKGL